MCQLCAKGFPGVGEIALPLLIIGGAMLAARVEARLRARKVHSK